MDWFVFFITLFCVGITLITCVMCWADYMRFIETQKTKSQVLQELPDSAHKSHVVAV